MYVPIYIYVDNSVIALSLKTLAMFFYIIKDVIDEN